PLDAGRAARGAVCPRAAYPDPRVGEAAAEGLGSHAALTMTGRGNSRRPEYNPDMNHETTSPAFVHLRVHSEFSVVDGIAKIPALVGKAVEYGQPALALTDLCNLFGFVKFYRAAQGKGIKPIAGTDVWLENELDRDKPQRVLLLARNGKGFAARGDRLGRPGLANACRGPAGRRAGGPTGNHAGAEDELDPDQAQRVSLLARNRQGYLSLCDLLSRAWLDNAYRGRAEIKREWLTGNDGLIVLSGGRAGDVGQALEAGRQDEAAALAREWARQYPDAYFIELQRSGAGGDESYVQAALRLAARLDLPVVATHPIQFLKPEDFRAHEARVCIAEGEQLGNPRRPRRFTEQQYMLSSEEMVQR